MGQGVVRAELVSGGLLLLAAFPVLASRLALLDVPNGPPSAPIPYGKYVQSLSCPVVKLDISSARSAAPTLV